MNCGAATAFLPNFVGFPSPRGLHSSPVQPGVCPPRRDAAHAPGDVWQARGRRDESAGARAPPCGRCAPSDDGLPARRRTAVSARRGVVVSPAGARFTVRTRSVSVPFDGSPPGHAPSARAELGCPVSAASAASAPASTGGSAAARGPAPARGAAAARCPGATGARPPAVGRARPPGAASRPHRPPGPVPAGGLGHRDDHDHDADRQDDAECDCHGVTLLPFPRNGPRSPPVGPDRCLRFSRDGPMPGRPTRQSRVEELQSFGAGWRP